MGYLICLTDGLFISTKMRCRTALREDRPISEDCLVLKRRRRRVFQRAVEAMIHGPIVKRTRFPVGEMMEMEVGREVEGWRRRGVLAESLAQTFTNDSAPTILAWLLSPLLSLEVGASILFSSTTSKGRMDSLKHMHAIPAGDHRCDTSVDHWTPQP